DVVGRLRRILRTRAVGHAGTLDPLATGVLVIGVGEGTKLLQHLTGADKEYVTTVRLGEQTESLDSQGSVIARQAVPSDLTRARVEEVAAGFCGVLRQRVPEISAVKVDGERLYARARRGEAVEAPEREVTVHALEILRVELPEVELRVRASKGFYVRSLGRDLALALGTVGHLTALRRTASGSFSVVDAAPGSLLDAEAEVAAGELRARMLPLTAALRGFPCCVLNEQGVIEVRHGRAVLAEHTLRRDLMVPGQVPVALVDEAGALRALGRAEEDRIVVIRGMSQS
ncbi:MAG TPA: tRNA pseudouridine(55) synthase TruB, partial [Polyangiales bacterium]|nr:tRNA pseudouridine(55) synthase TruB [Polyangiales bacterium]